MLTAGEASEHFRRMRDELVANERGEACKTGGWWRMIDFRTTYKLYCKTRQRFLPVITLFTSELE